MRARVSFERAVQFDEIAGIQSVDDVARIFRARFFTQTVNLQNVRAFVNQRRRQFCLTMKGIQLDHFVFEITDPVQPGQRVVNKFVASERDGIHHFASFFRAVCRIQQFTEVFMIRTAQSIQRHTQFGLTFKIRFLFRHSAPPALREFCQNGGV